MPQTKPIIIGTRGSDLALWQANFVRKELEQRGHQIQIQIIKTQGDKIQDLSFDKMESFYTLSFQGKNIGQVSLSVPGEHNVLNSLAAAAIGFELGIDPIKIISGINSYEGVRRRFEIKGAIILSAMLI